MSEAKVAVILNPTSGRGSGARKWPEAERLLRDFPLTVFKTEHSGHATELARQRVQEGYATVMAAGGDGTLSEVASALVGTQCRMACLPFGTGNDFCRSLGIETDLKKAVDTVRDGIEKKIDLLRWEAGPKDGWCLNVAGCGFDAAVAHRINTGYRSLRGTAAYIAAVLETLRKYQPVNLTIRVDGELTQVEAMLCAVANATSYGGGMKIAPDALIDDGQLDVAIVGKVSKTEFLKTFPKVFKGTHVTHPKVSIQRGKKITIESDGPCPVLVDGELVGVTPITFEVVPAALSILTPR